MKKIILIMLSLFLLAGCNKKDDDSSAPESVKLSELNNTKITYLVDGNITRTDTYHANGIVSTTIDSNTTTATYEVNGTILSHISSTTDHSIDTNNGQIEVGGTYTHQTTPTTTSTAVVQQVTTGVSKKETLMAMGLDSIDADYLLAHHASDVDIVINQKNRIFKNLHLDVSMFVDGTDPDSSIYDGVQAGGQNVAWSGSEITAFKKMFGRIAFMVNAPQFKTYFNQSVALLNPTYQGTGANDIPFPDSYQTFKTAANAALATYGNHYKFFLTTRSSGLGYGILGLKLQLEQEMFQPTSTLNNTLGLMLHEMSHTWGYVHAGNDAGTTLKPNNIPYYLQFLLAYSANDPGNAVINGAIVPGHKGLNEIYFGQ